MWEEEKMDGKEDEGGSEKVKWKDGEIRWKGRWIRGKKEIEE